MKRRLSRESLILDQRVWRRIKAEEALMKPSKRGRLRDEQRSSPPARPPMRTRSGPAEGEKAILRQLCVAPLRSLGAWK